MMTRIRYLATAAAVASLCVACESSVSGPAGQASVQVLLTDAPAELIGSAEVTISRVYLQRGDDEEGDGGGRVDLFNDPENPKVYDLLTLRDGITADLTGLMDIPEGEYAQLRLVVT